jgi:hypothetical protein
MKRLYISLCFVLLLFLGSGCDLFNGGGTQTGTLQYRTTTWNTEFPDAMPKASRDALATDTLKLIDVIQYLAMMEVTTDAIDSGVTRAEDVNWTVIYQSTEEMLTTHRDFSVELPVGDYKGYRVTQGNRLYWVCTSGNDTLEIPSLNDNSRPHNDLIIGHINDKGFYEINDDGIFIKKNDEKLGVFEIRPATLTKITVRMNLMALVIDSQAFAQDSTYNILDWLLPEGISTMSDFIVDYDD